MPSEHEVYITLNNLVEEYSEEQLRYNFRVAFRTLIDLGGFDGAHHKQYCIDQAVRIMAGNKYDDLIKSFKKGVDGDNTYDWDEGIAP